MIVGDTPVAGVRESGVDEGSIDGACSTPRESGPSMLPDSTVPGSLTGLLTVFRPCFTTPTFSTFSGLVVGLIAQTRRRTVCGMLLGVGLERVWHHARAHRFFATARWCADAVGLVMLDLIVDRLLPDGS